MTRGRMRAIWAASQSQQASTSWRVGTRFPGGRHLTMFAMYTPSRDKPTEARIWVRSCPAGPTNGRPVSSSTSPGPSPTNRSGERGSPSPNTTVRRLSASGQRRQSAAF